MFPRWKGKDANFPKNYFRSQRINKGGESRSGANTRIEGGKLEELLHLAGSSEETNTRFLTGRASSQGGRGGRK